MHPLLLRQPERVGFAGDWHGSADFAEVVLDAAAQKGADIVLQVGDFGLNRDQAGDQFADRVDARCKELGVAVLWVDGNHDDHDVLEQIPRFRGLGRIRDRLWHLPRGMRWQWGGLAWGALGGAASVDRPTRQARSAWWPQESLTQADVACWLQRGPVDVVVTHDAPAGADVPGVSAAVGALLWGFEAMAASQANREKLADALVPTRPSLVVHGHFHVRYQGTWLYPGGRARIVGLGADGGDTAANLWVADVGELRSITEQMRNGH